MALRVELLGGWDGCRVFAMYIHTTGGNYTNKKRVDIIARNAVIGG
jgi:hypothetical protein